MMGAFIPPKARLLVDRSLTRREWKYCCRGVEWRVYGQVHP